MHEPDRTSEAFDAILKSRLSLAELEATMRCPEPSTLAAVYDRTIDARERDHLEAHFAECARCQMMLAAMARSDDGLVVEEQSERGFNWARLLRFGVPAFAAAAALLVIYVIRNPTAGVERSSDLAMNAPLSAPAQPQPESEAASNMAAGAAAPAPPAPQAPAPPAGSAGGFAAGPIARSAAAFAVPKPQRLEGDKAESAPSNAEMLAQADVSGAPNSDGTTYTIKSPDNNASWVIGPHGSIVKHTGSGKVITQQSNVTEDLTRGAAISAKDAWIVGKHGTILRTRDGGHYWEAVTSPTMEDLEHVRAADSRDAVIRTVTGKSYATIDGGQTWQRQ